MARTDSPECTEPRSCRRAGQWRLCAIRRDKQHRKFAPLLFYAVQFVPRTTLMLTKKSM